MPHIRSRCSDLGCWRRLRSDWRQIARRPPILGAPVYVVKVPAAQIPQDYRGLDFIGAVNAYRQRIDSLTRGVVDRVGDCGGGADNIDLAKSLYSERMSSLSGRASRSKQCYEAAGQKIGWFDRKPHRPYGRCTWPVRGGLGAYPTSDGT